MFLSSVKMAILSLSILTKRSYEPLNEITQFLQK
jgi:hypothetical protein